jgi:hypothetical protein
MVTVISCIVSILVAVSVVAFAALSRARLSAWRSIEEVYRQTIRSIGAVMNDPEAPDIVKQKAMMCLVLLREDKLRDAVVGRAIIVPSDSAGDQSPQDERLTAATMTLAAYTALMNPEIAIRRWWLLGALRMLKTLQRRLLSAADATNLHEAHVVTQQDRVASVELDHRLDLLVRHTNNPVGC